MAQYSQCAVHDEHGHVCGTTARKTRVYRRLGAGDGVADVYGLLGAVSASGFAVAERRHPELKVQRLGAPL